MVCSLCVYDLFPVCSCFVLLFVVCSLFVLNGVRALFLFCSWFVLLGGVVVLRDENETGTKRELFFIENDLFDKKNFRWNRKKGFSFYKNRLR